MVVKIKIKSIILMGVILLTLLSISATSADTIVMNNYTFSIPDGYTVIENDTDLIMYNDDLLIAMYQGSIIDPSEAKQKRIDSGFTFLGEKDYSYDGVMINQQNYNHDGYNFCIYTFEKNNKPFIISLVVDEDDPVPEYKDNPVTEIIHSLT